MNILFIFYRIGDFTVQYLKISSGQSTWSCRVLDKWSFSKLGKALTLQWAVSWMSYTGSEKDRFAQNISAIPETPDRKALQHDLITYFNITTSPCTHSINILTLKYTISFCFFTSCLYLRYSENFTLNNMWNSSHLLWFPQKGPKQNNRLRVALQTFPTVHFIIQTAC